MEFNSVILEQILTFLPDQATGILPQVNKSWYQEIGTSSPALWKYLLRRNDWFTSNDLNLEEAEMMKKAPTRDVYRDVFLSNHKLLQSMRWMTACFRMNCSKTHNDNDTAPIGIKKTEKRTFLMFPKQEGEEEKGWDYGYNIRPWDYARSSGVYCLRLWEDPQKTGVIAVHKFELFLTLITTQQNQDGFTCQQYVKVRVAPIEFSNSNVTRCSDMDVDKDIVCCAISVMDVAKYLTCIPRAALNSVWEESSQNHEIVLEMAELELFDMSKSFFQYCAANIDSNMFHGALLEYIQRGHSLTDLTLSINNICTCGKGLIMFEAWVCRPTGTVKDELMYWRQDVDLVNNLVRVVGLFSVPQASIVYIDSLPDEMGNIVLSKYFPQNPLAPLKIVCTSNETSEVILFDVLEDDGRLMRDELVMPQGFLEQEGWEHCNWRRHSVVTTDEIIIGDVCSNDVQEYIITLSFIPLESNMSVTGCSMKVLNLKGTKAFENYQNNIFEISSMHISGDYLIVIHFAQITQVDTDLDYDILGLIAVHIPSRKELYFELFDEVSLERGCIEIPELLCYTKNSESIVSCMHSNGCIMTSVTTDL